jgi:hypothetical protein
MTKFDFSSTLIGSIAGGFFSIIASFLNLSCSGILLSNIIAGFVAVYISEQKEDYILIGGVSGIVSSFIMLLFSFLLADTPIGFKNLTIFGFIAVAISISGGGFILGAIGGYISKKLVNK